ANFWDSLQPRIESGKLTLIGEATSEAVASSLMPGNFLTTLQPIEVPALGEAEIAAILDEAIDRSELDFPEEARRRLAQLARSYLPSAHGPKPLLDLFDKVRDYRLQKKAIGEDEPLTSAFVEKVFSVYHGLPLFVVSRDETKPAREIRSWFRDRIIGQEAGIDAVVEAITLFKAGLHDPTRPIGTFLFAGPTGVGKTELARALSIFLFGSPRRLLRFDLSEFKDYSSFEMLVGRPNLPESPARLLDPVRAQPFQVILLDELEKAHPNVWDVLLQVLDDGRLSPPKGDPVNFTNTIVIATTNVGAADMGRNAIGVGMDEAGDGANMEAARQGLERTFRPEFLNRFQHLVLFHPLTADQVARITRLELKALISREGIAERGLAIDVPDIVIRHIVRHAYDQRYGVRGLKRALQRQIILPVASLLLERTVDPGSIIQVTLRRGRTAASVVETPSSREYRRAREPVTAIDGRRWTKPEMRAALEAFDTRFDDLRRAADEPALREDIERIDGLRADPAFWKDLSRASRIIEEQNFLLKTVARLDGLADRLSNARIALQDAALKRDLERLGEDLTQIERRLVSGWRDLVSIGREGAAPALIGITPIGKHPRLRDLLYTAYRDWAAWRGLELDLLREPLTESEPVLLRLDGHYPYGYLRGEAGHHRLRKGDDHVAARVQVAPITDEPGDPALALGEHQALKKRGLYDGRVRSRVTTADGSFVLQNAKTLNENRERISELAAAWAMAPEAPQEVIRRYDLKPFFLRDFATGFDTGKGEVLKPEGFHELLCKRIDLTDASAEALEPS
ncbi:MAG: AAA family ATPase, partial [Pseudomonadota bacterium]